MRSKKGWREKGTVLSRNRAKSRTILRCGWGGSTKANCPRGKVKASIFSILKNQFISSGLLLPRFPGYKKITNQQYKLALDISETAKPQQPDIHEKWILTRRSEVGSIAKLCSSSFLANITFLNLQGNELIQNRNSPRFWANWLNGLFI